MLCDVILICSTQLLGSLLAFFSPSCYHPLACVVETEALAMLQCVSFLRLKTLIESIFKQLAYRLVILHVKEEHCGLLVTRLRMIVYIYIYIQVVELFVCSVLPTHPMEHVQLNQSIEQ